MQKKISLSDKYEKREGKIFLTGIQALVRLPLIQKDLDTQNNLNTGGFISGYKGSPLGGYDLELSKAQKYLDDFKTLYNDAGIFSKQNVENYFPRVYNFAQINRNPDEFKKVLTEIFKLKKAKNPTKEAEKFFNKINDISEFNLIKTNIDDLINDKKISQNYILTPLSNHITKQRVLTGPYKQVEKLLTDGNFLINQLSS